VAELFEIPWFRSLREQAVEVAGAAEVFEG
jgi:hypothetical protein